MTFVKAFSPSVFIFRFSVRDLLNWWMNLDIGFKNGFICFLCSISIYSTCIYIQNSGYLKAIKQNNCIHEDISIYFLLPLPLFVWKKIFVYDALHKYCWKAFWHIPVNTLRRFNAVTTLYRHQQRRYNVETTSCVHCDTQYCQSSIRNISFSWRIFYGSQIYFPFVIWSPMDNLIIKWCSWVA